MDAKTLKANIAAMDDAELTIVIAALTKAREIAMTKCVAARIPECGSFGEIAQDLDYAMSTLADPTPVAVATPMPADV